MKCCIAKNITKMKCCIAKNITQMKCCIAKNITQMKCCIAKKITQMKKNKTSSSFHLKRLILWLFQCMILEFFIVTGQFLWQFDKSDLNSCSVLNSSNMYSRVALVIFGFCILSTFRYGYYFSSICYTTFMLMQEINIHFGIMKQLTKIPFLIFIDKCELKWKKKDFCWS